MITCLNMKDAPRIEISVILPIYNPTHFFVDHYLSLSSLLQVSVDTYEIILVDDGSRRPVEALIGSGLDNCSKVVIHEKNLGKGAALKSGVNLARMEWVAFLDGDGDIPASQLLKFLDKVPLISDPKYGGALGSKIDPKAEVHASLFRKVATKLFHFASTVFVRKDLPDTQTGIKVFKKKCIDEIDLARLSNGYLFELELVDQILRNGWELIAVPIVMVKRHGSTISVGRILEIGKDFARVVKLKYLH